MDPGSGYHFNAISKCFTYVRVSVFNFSADHMALFSTP
jgi:hypothetical protein